MIPEQAKIVRILEALFPNIKIYLFGSRARGTNRPTSDIDLALDAGRELSFLEIAQARNILENLDIPEKIDIVDMHSIPIASKETILKEGKIWKN